ncbi:MAG: phosphatidate cytidylyltransferase [Deltaproteobacteria bacterium]|nr:phosphatidate cytidylyltransferase [Deltaproteobacteria bacterium]
MSEAGKKSGTGLRVVSALVLLPVVLFLCWWGGWPFRGLILVVAAICGWEFGSIALKEAPATLRWVTILGSVALPLYVDLWAGEALVAREGLLIACWTVVGLLSLAVFGAREDLKALPGQAGMAVLGIVYVGGLFAVLVHVRGFGLWWLVLTMAVTWLNDTGAYFTGRAFGKHPLSRFVSPKKTWEGFAGGVVASIAGAFLVGWLAGALPMIAPEPIGLSVPLLLLLGVLAGFLGPVGDLAESLFKRAYGVKDSGKLIPGHGGFLDRIDAFLFNAVLVWTFALLT